MPEINIVVFGMTSPTCILHDLGMDVPQGVVVTIPASRGYNSKDLWRAIGQRQIFRLNSGPNAPKPPLPPVVPLMSAPEPAAPPPPPAAAPPPEPELLEDMLEEENKALRAALLSQSSKLDSILDLLKAGVPTSTIQSAVTAPTYGVVGGEAPVFIPSTIAPEISETRIESQRSETGNDAVLGATGKLRELRAAKKQ